MNRTEFRGHFGTRGPVVLPVIHVLDTQRSLANIDVLIDAGAPGCFLINHDFDVDAFLPIVRGTNNDLIRWYAVSVGWLELALMCYIFWAHYAPTQANFQIVETFAWIPALGQNWTVSVDGLSAPLVLLAGLVTTLSMLSAWRVNRRPRLFYSLMLVLYAAQIGVFVAQDLLLFFIMWEVELVPVYLLVCIWGGQNRRYAATKFLIYTAAASIFILVAALAMAF